MDKAIIVAVNLNNSNQDLNNELSELKSLCEACDIEISDTIIQNLPSVNPVAYVGKGKLEEIKRQIEQSDIHLIITNDELTPLQVANLQQELDAEIYDRTYIILEIFRSRARTKEAIMQVELASQKYMLPHLIGANRGLSRQRGVGGGGMARGRGLGEQKLELERRNIYDRVARINQELKDLADLRKQQRVSRKKNNMKIVSLVGYTNSGKSSTMNAMMQYSVSLRKDVFEKDMLFATLETSTRLIKTEKNMQFLLIDTVGFINKLPHQLVEAFKSTLEEIKESDLIVHIVDSANPNFRKQIEVTNHVLEEIGVKDIPLIYAFNKIDLAGDYFCIPPEYPDALQISATKNISLDLLLKKIEEELFRDYSEVTLRIPFSEQALANTVRENAIIRKFAAVEDSYEIEAKVSAYLYSQVKKFEMK